MRGDEIIYHGVDREGLSGSINYTFSPQHLLGGTALMCMIPTASLPCLHRLNRRGMPSDMRIARLFWGTEQICVVNGSIVCLFVYRIGVI